MKALWLTLLARWTASSLREQRLIAIAAMIVFCALVWWVAIEPAFNGRARLNQQLPDLRLQASELAGLAAQGSIRPVFGKTSDLIDRLRATLNAAGFDPNSAEAVDQERVLVRLSAINYARVISWLAGLKAGHGAHLESATVTLQEPGRVEAELVFQRKTD
jgi:general secretion pathway protein M